MTVRPRPASFSRSLRTNFESQLHAHALTPRESCVAVLILEGLSNKEIAAQCRISELTVKDHLKHIYQKTGTHQRTALLALLLGTAQVDTKNGANFAGAELIPPGGAARAPRRASPPAGR